MTSIVLKPWGSYQVIEEGEKYIVKKIIVKPECKLSLQSHKHRSEHWVVAQGSATVTVGNTVKNLKLNESVFIPKQQKHRLVNNKKEDLIIIEVQYGSILQEDDIIRYADIYNRK